MPPTFDSGWTVDTLRIYLEALLAANQRNLENLFSAKDLRDQQRFDAQQKALTDALLAAEKAVAAALTAADTAVNKAEQAAERRLDGVNTGIGKSWGFALSVLSIFVAASSFAVHFIH